MVTIPGIAERPKSIIWDITYACPLRCVHCYSESGRRPTRQLGLADMHLMVDAIIAAKPAAVGITGGEPLTVRGIFELLRRIADAGIRVQLFTSGWPMTPEIAAKLGETVERVIVSVDGATAEMHDSIRGRKGSFDRAMSALSMLDEESRQRRARGQNPLWFGVDCVVMRSNFGQLEQYCTEMAPRFPELSAIEFGTAVPTGLASRTGFDKYELVSDEQYDELGRTELPARLQSLAPASVDIACTNNAVMMWTPAQLAAGQYFQAIVVEPDGAVRAMPNYEGVVGNLLDEPVESLWRKAIERWSDPFVVETLSPVTTMSNWAVATRAIDYHFGTDQVRARIDRRPEFSGPVLLPAP